MKYKLRRVEKWSTRGYKPGQLKRTLIALRSQLARVAQKVVRDWDEDWAGSGGACDEVASAMLGVLSSRLRDGKAKAIKAVQGT